MAEDDTDHHAQQGQQPSWKQEGALFLLDMIFAPTIEEEDREMAIAALCHFSEQHEITTQAGYTRVRLLCTVQQVSTIDMLRADCFTSKQYDDH